MEKQKLIYVESKAQFSPSEVSDKAIVFIKDTKEIWTHGIYFSCSGTWATPITLSLTGDTTGSVSIDGSGNASLATTTNYITIPVCSSLNKDSTKFSVEYAGGSNSVSTKPGGVDAFGVMRLRTADGWYGQIMMSSNSAPGIYYRNAHGLSSSVSWVKLLDSGNYTSFPHTFASLTNKPTTLSGYGITDCIPIISGRVTPDTDLSTLGMTTTGAKLSVSYTSDSGSPSWLYQYSNFLMFRSTVDTYGGIATATFHEYVTFIGGRNPETASNNAPNWWFRIYGTNGQTYNLATIQTAINNLGSTYLPLTGGTLTDTLILKAGAFTASNSNSYSGGRYQAVAKPNIRLIGDSTYGLSTIEFISQKGDTSINKPSDSGFIQFQPYGVSALSSVGSHPTLKTSGETNALVLGVTNDADDIIVLQSPNVSGLRHACGTTEYYLPHVTTSTTTANKPLVSTTTAHVYTLGAECLPLSGGTMTGKITLWSSNADAANTGGLNANNSNIYGLNSLYFADASETAAAEGINFYRSSTTVDSLWGSNGNLYWTPNRTYGSAGTSYYVLTSNNYSIHLNNTYLPLSGGTMTGNIILTTGSSYIADSSTSSSILGAFASGNAAEGLSSEAGVLVGKLATQVTLRSNGDDLWHYRNSDKKRYKILDAANYTNYTINYAKTALIDAGSVGVIDAGKLYYNSLLSFAMYAPDDNGGKVSYELIAELPNYGTGTNTSYVDYGISGFIWSRRGGNCSNSSAYPITAIVSIGPGTNSKLRVPVTTHVLVPFIVKYNDVYYLALRKDSSGAYFYFMGQKYNLLTTTIRINDTSLIEVIKGPETETSTAMYYYNNGSPQEYLHSGNYSSYALPRTGGTLGSSTASYTELFIQSSTAKMRLMAYSDSVNYIQSGNSTFDGNTTLKITGYSATTGSNLYFNFANIYCRAGDYINIDSGNYSSYALPLSGGTMTGTINCEAIVPITDNGYSIGTSSKTLYEIHANFFKRRGSSNDYVLLGGGEHKLISDFVQNYTAVVPGGSVGNNDSWTLILNNNYSTGWYNPCTMFYIRGHNFGCGILCFYHYWDTSQTSGYYDNSVWFFGAEHSAYSGTMGGTGRDINNFLKVYIDKDNDNLKIYYNRYNNQGIQIQELQFSQYQAGTLYPKGQIRASHFITNGAVTDLPITSSTFVNIPIQTAKNHTEDIKTTRSVYASAFYENSDIRLKENVHSIDQADLLKNVDLVQFNFKNNQNKKYGVIAQQLEQVGLQNLVYENNGNKAVDYISLLVLEIQRLRNEIGELKQEINKKN